MIKRVEPDTNLSEDTASALGRINLPIAKATGLPNACYTTDSGFISDREQIFARNWVGVGFVDQLPEKNYAAPVDLMGLPLLLTRDSQDIIRVFHNVCSHRGMQLSDTACKNNGSLRCPYHNWVYALDGALTTTPHLGGYGVHTHTDFDQSAHGLIEIPSAIWLGTVFVNLAGNAPAFADIISPLLQQWSRFTTETQLARFTGSDDSSKMTFSVGANWKLAVENYLDSYHLPSVHPELNRVSPLEQHFCVEQFERGGGQGSLNYQRLSIDGKSLPTLTGWPLSDANRAEYPTLYPNTFFGIHADQLFVMFLQPISQERTLEHVRLFYVDSVGAHGQDYQPHRHAIAKGWKQVFEEDIFAVERMQKGRNSPAYRGGVFSPEMDHPTHHFHKWVAQQFSFTA